MLLRLSCLLALCIPFLGCAATTAPPVEDNGAVVNVQNEIVLNPEVVLTGDDGALVDAQLLDDGRLELTYAGSPEVEFAAGDIIVGDQGDGYMVRVMAVEEGSNVRRVTTEAATLDDVIESGAFSVGLNPRTEEFILAGDETGGRSSALGGSFSFVNDGLVGGSTSCTGAGGGDVDFTYDFDTDELETEFLFDKSGFARINEVGVELQGSAAVTATLTTSGHVNVQCIMDVVEALRLRPIIWQKRFRVGPLRLRARFTIVPVFEINTNVNIEPTTFETTVRLTGDLDATAAWRRGRGIEVDANLQKDIELDVDLEEGGEASASITAHAGLYFNLDINLLNLPSASATLDAGASIQTNDAACTYDWEAYVEGQAGISGGVGVDLGFFSRDFVTIDESFRFSRATKGGDNVDLPYCEPDTCETDEDCIDGEHCNTEAGICQECLMDEHCGGEEMCVSGRCAGDGDRPDLTSCSSCIEEGLEWCASSNSCVEDATDCEDARTTPSQCVECDAAADCESCVGISGVCRFDETGCFNSGVRDDWSFGTSAGNPGQCEALFP